MITLYHLIPEYLWMSAETTQTAFASCLSFGFSSYGKSARAPRPALCPAPALPCPCLICSRNSENLSKSPTLSAACALAAVCLPFCRRGSLQGAERGQRAKIPRPRWHSFEAAAVCFPQRFGRNPGAAKL